MSEAREPTTAATTAPARSRAGRRVGLAVMLLAIGCAAAMFALHRVADGFRRGLPALPDGKLMNTPMAAQISDADAAARLDPLGPDALGGLGMAYHANLFLKQAVVCYDLAILRDPGAWVWHYLRALALSDMGEEEELVKAYENVTRVNPSLGLGWYRLGEAWLKVGNNAMAEEVFRKARELLAAATARSDEGPIRPGRLPLSVHAALGEAQAILRQGRLDDALRIASDLAAQRPGFGPAWSLMEQVYRVKGMNEDAERCYKRNWGAVAFQPPTDAIEINLRRRSSNTTYLLYAADLAKRAGDGEEALSHARRAAEAAPDDAETLSNIAQIILDYDEPATALTLFERATKLSPGNVVARSGVAVAMAATGRQFAAANLMRSVVDASPRDPEARFRFGLVQRATGDVRAAEAEFRRAIELGVANKSGVSRELGKLLNAAGRFDDARKVFESALALQENDWNQRVELAASLTGLGRHADAAEQLREASLYTPDDARLLHDWSEALLKTGDAKAAATVAERIPVVEPSSPRAHFYFATVAAQAGRNQDAAYHCEVALRLRPEFREAVELLAAVKSRPSLPVASESRPVAEPAKVQGSVTLGAEVYRAYCAACHTSDGTPGIGPTFHKLVDRERTFLDGSRLTADEDYIRDSILDPQKRIVRGFQPLMPKVRLSEKQLASVVVFIKSLGE